MRIGKFPLFDILRKEVYGIMKKLICAFILILVLCSCGANEDVVASDSVVSPTEAVMDVLEPSEASTEVFMYPDLRTVIPDPHDLFPDVMFSFNAICDELTNYGFVMNKGITYEMFLQYRQACRDLGFKRVILESEEIYWANDENMWYRLELYWTENTEDPDQNYIMAYVRVEDGEP